MSFEQAASDRRSKRIRDRLDPPLAADRPVKRPKVAVKRGAATISAPTTFLKVARPTPAELRRAEQVRASLKAAQIIGDRGRPVQLNVLACAIALWEQPYEDDVSAKRLFGVAATTDVRGVWVDGCWRNGERIEAKLARLDAHERAERQAAAAAKAAAKLQAEARRRATQYVVPAGAHLCHGFTLAGQICKVHSAMSCADAAPLRAQDIGRGLGLFCAHHHPAKYTGQRCAGHTKKRCMQRCNVYSGSVYKEAAPLRAGSMFCDFHRQRCAGRTRLGKPCRVTSSDEHAHAYPLRRGERYCAHHTPPPAPRPSLSARAAPFARR